MDNKLTLRDLAKLGALAQLANIMEQRDFIAEEFPELFTSDNGENPMLLVPAKKKRGRPPKAHNPPTKHFGGRGPLTDAQRLAVSKRMKKYHAARRKAKTTSAASKGND